VFFFARQIYRKKQNGTGKSSPTISPNTGWILGWVSAVNREGRTIWIADAHRGDGKRYIVRSDEILTAFLELESAVATT
jgi:hypothetical protein